MSVTHHGRKAVTKHRRRAKGVGFFAGVGVTGLAMLIIALFVGDVMEDAPEASRCAWIGAMCAVVLVGGGWIGRWYAQNEDAEHYVMQKAPPLPLHLVNEHDDAWLEGELYCPHALTAPHFGTRCAWYHYVEKEKRGSGKHSHWVTLTDVKRHHRAWVRDGDLAIELRLDTAKFEHLPTSSAHEGRRSHSLEYLAARGPVSACGVVVKGGTATPPEKEMAEFWGADAPDSRWALAPYRHVPLMVTPMPRPEWYDRAEAEEIVWAVASAVALFVGLSAGVWWTGVQFLGIAYDATAWWLGAGALGFLLLLPLLAVAKYNRFVGYRLRVNNARSHVDVDLKARHDLIPNLVKAAQAAAAHERETLEAVAEQRRRAQAPDADLDRESELGRATRRVLGLVERYPELKSNEAFEKVTRELTAIEEKIAFGRGFYNDVVAEYNTLIESFPNAYFAAPLGFRPFGYWAD